MRRKSLRDLKIELRERIKKILRKIDEEERRRVSEEIKRNLLSLKILEKKNNILIYFSKSPEIDTTSIIEELHKEGKNIYLPKIIDSEILPAVLDGFENLKKGKYGIMEPTSSVFVDEEKIDAVILPGIAFDTSGRRLGRGKGYFDRFLKRCRNAIKIALSYSFQVVEEVPEEENDERVNVIVTENEVIFV
ncbi:MAG: 5-formyltetrahydrofolate cyclo-ligase [Caldiserica bacterium]|nr:MAG: 5-formyltetrahydrofolate cyclo-ligase [Caldisericota bacterium]